jgi:hypothetical protein
VDSRGCTHEVSDRNEDFNGNWTRGHSYYVLTKNLTTFCPCLETLRKADFKSDGRKANMKLQGLMFALMGFRLALI